MDAGLKRELEEKVRAGERLTREDGIALYASDDLAWLGGLAHEVRTRKNGDVVHFNVNRHLNMTNVCTASCAYCSFQRKPGEKDAYTMRIEEAVRLAKAMEGENLTELHIVNGLHPTLPWRYYPRSLSALKEALPDVALKAFTATEIHHFETISGLSASEILDELIEAGLESLTGGGAEIFDWEVRQHIVDHRTHWEDWSRIHRLAHEKGLKTPATMLYGHIEEHRHRVDHVLRLREMQDETGGFQVFIPLRYQHDFVDMKDGKVRNKLQARTTMATGAEALKTFAVSRLLFDNVPHVKVFWVMHGVQTAQLALQHGADDMDGSVVEYKITHDADDFGTPNKLGRDDLLDLIRDAGFRPVERNTATRSCASTRAPTRTGASRRSRCASDAHRVAFRVSSRVSFRTRAPARCPRPGLSWVRQPPEPREFGPCFTGRAEACREFPGRERAHRVRCQAERDDPLHGVAPADLRRLFLRRRCRRPLRPRSLRSRRLQHGLGDPPRPDPLRAAQLCAAAQAARRDVRADRRRRRPHQGPPRRQPHPRGRGSVRFLTRARRAYRLPPGPVPEQTAPERGLRRSARTPQRGKRCPLTKETL